MSTIETFNGNLGIPRSKASRTLLEIAANVLAHPVLQAKIKTWVVPGRDMSYAETALDPDFVIPAAVCPLILIWPDPRSGGPITNSKQQVNFSVLIWLWVDTVDPLDCLDFYGLVESALAPDSVANGQALRERLGPITGWHGSLDLDQPGVSGFPSTGGPVMQARGAVSTRYNVPSF